MCFFSIFIRVCESLKSGIAAFIGGTDDEDIENVIRSISARTQIPFIETHWKTCHRPPDPYVINLYPEPNLLAQARYIIKITMSQYNN